MILDVREQNGNFEATADVIVVGTGAGGGPAAAILAEAGLNVVVLEKGGFFQASDFNGNAADMMRLLWAGEGFHATKDGTITLTQGECIGGSTVINMCLSWRPPVEALERWRLETGVEGWSEADLKPHVDEVWETVGVETVPRTHINRTNYVFEFGAHALGWKVQPMARNVRNCQNSGLCTYGCPVNAKQSMLLTYVPRAEKAGARILAGAQAMRLLVKDGRATGVEGVLRDPIAKKPIGNFKVMAPRVVLSAGALETPGLLLRSGLEGRYKTAGKYFQVHTHTFAHGIMDEPVYMQFGAPQSIAIMEFADVFGHTGPGFVIEGLGVHPEAFSVLATQTGQAHARQMKAFQHVAMADAILRDRSRGHVELTGEGRPVAVYPHTEGDKKLIRDSMYRTAECLLAGGAKEVFVPGTHGGPITSMAKLNVAMESIHQNPGMYALLTTHLFSSARMAGSPELGYCDSRGQAWDTKGLYVADGSSLPSNLGANPQITIMSVARKIATHIVEDAKAG